MDGPDRELMERLPLAQAALVLWGWLVAAGWLADVFERHRGRAYERVLTFGVFVHLIRDALVEHQGSGRQSFERAAERGELTSSVQAAYGKLRRIPIPLSMAFLAEGSDRLRHVLPTADRRSELPSSLREFEVIVLDGKAIKNVAKRLKPARGFSGGVLGGKALVALSLNCGLTIAMHAHPDGDAHETRFVPELLPVVRQRIAGRRLWLSDRAFCYREQLAGFAAEEDAYVVRYRTCVPFHPDAACSPQAGRDVEGRRFTQRWGWIHGGRKGEREYVRQITLERPGQESLILVTNLPDDPRAAGGVRAQDVLALYRMRWGIEKMFEQVTEVFGLQRLIGSTPEASVFQFAFCLLLYNVIQVVRLFVAAAQRREPESVSTEKLFVDVRRELTAWSLLLAPRTATTAPAATWRVADVRARLRGLLQSVWTDRWIKAPSRARRPGPDPPRPTSTHTSIHRLLRNDRGGDT